jgi:glutamyl-tRNA synthetase
VEFDWAQEQDHVVQRADGSCLYHLASVVDDEDFGITHVIRAEEHLSNTPRQVFLLQSLGYRLPQYAHLPFVAEPGSRNKLSKRKLDQYLKNKGFAAMMEHGQQIADRLGLHTSRDTFNPVITDFYQQVGYLPEAIINYLALLGWSLDDKTEHFTRQELIGHFSLERVNKAAASFDPKKLQAFQERHMAALPIDAKTDMVLPYLARAGWVASPPGPDCRANVARVLAAAGDRVKTAGDILAFPEFFVSDAQLPIDAAALAKHLGRPEPVALLRKYRDRIATVEPFDAQTLDRATREFVAAEGIEIGEIIHAVRVAVTGKTVGIGLFDALALLGRGSALTRIDRALREAEALVVSQ